MLCDICKKKEAVIHIQEISAAGKKIINLCNDCAEKHPQNDPLLHFGSLNFSDVLENIKKISADLVKQKVVQNNTQVCPVCGWTMQKMEENNGLLGCSECYKTFAGTVQNAVNSIHHSEIHTGKRPASNSREIPELRREKIRKLEEELQTAVQAEEYEQAAVIRDRINALKKGSAEDAE